MYYINVMYFRGGIKLVAEIAMVKRYSVNRLVRRVYENCIHLKS